MRRAEQQAIELAGATRPAGGRRDVTARTRDAALRELVDIAGRRGYAIARDLLGDPAEAEDAVQDALARACERWGTLRARDALVAWFLRILTNRCLRLLRRRRLFRTVRRLAGLDEPAPELEVAAPAPAADVQLARARDVGRTLAALDELPTMQRATLLLRYGHDLPVPEIARMLGVGEGTVKTHLTRGLARLRDRLDEGTP